CLRVLISSAAVLGVFSLLPMTSDRASGQGPGRFRPNLPPRQIPANIRPTPPTIFGNAGGNAGTAGAAVQGAIGGGIQGGAIGGAGIGGGGIGGGIQGGIGGIGGGIGGIGGGI